MTALQKTAFLPAPEPSAGVHAYTAELAARLNGYARTRENYLRAARARDERKLKLQSKLDYLPTRLDIENVSRCNFKCTMCAVSTWRRGKRAGDMSLAHFKSIIDEQYGLVEIKLNGLGEALMQGDDYFEMIRYARERRIWVRMTTNASLLHLKDNYKKLIDSGVNEVDISIDGADAKTFQRIRVGSDFARVIHNCELLNDYCRTQNVSRAKMWTLVQRANAHALETHVDLAKRIGFRQVVFSTALHDWANPKLRDANAADSVGVEHEYAQRLVVRGHELGVRVAFWNVATKFTRENLCPWPFERGVITSDRRTVPCCMIGDPDQFELGAGLSPLEAWRGEEYRVFRLAHLSGDLPAVCRGCYKDEERR